MTTVKALKRECQEIRNRVKVPNDLYLSLISIVGLP